MVYLETGSTLDGLAAMSVYDNKSPRCSDSQYILSTVNELRLVLTERRRGEMLLLDLTGYFMIPTL